VSQSFVYPLKSVVIAVVVAAALTACGGKNRVNEAAGAAGEQGDSSATTGALDGGIGPTVYTPTDSAAAVLSQDDIVYFELDSSEIRREYWPALQRHAQRLAGDGALQLRLEGHADERGSREYNVGLGERRAQAVLRQLTLGGAPQAQMQTFSYGEERPANPGTGEDAWAQNRRVELHSSGR
jgi:peptidoglycan-associated lipoprotein